MSKTPGQLAYEAYNLACRAATETLQLQRPWSEVSEFIRNVWERTAENFLKVAPRPPEYYLLHVESGVTPQLRGPFASEEEQDEYAKLLRLNWQDNDDSLFWVILNQPDNDDSDTKHAFGAYINGFFQPAEGRGEATWLVAYRLSHKLFDHKIWDSSLKVFAVDKAEAIAKTTAYVVKHSNDYHTEHEPELLCRARKLDPTDPSDDLFDEFDTDFGDEEE